MEPRLLESIQVAARTGNLDRLVRAGGRHAASLGFPRERISEIELAVEEILANICLYAYPEGEGKLSVKYLAENHPVKLVVEIVDSGIPFNILNAPPPDLTSELEQRSVGGLGVYLVRELADAAEYERSESMNVVRLVFNAVTE